MKPLRRLASNRSFHTGVLTVALFAVAVFLAAPPALASGSLWLFPEESLPQASGEDFADDPAYASEGDGAWTAGVYLVEEGAFTLDLLNRAHGQGDLTAYETILVVAVNDPELIDSLSLEIGGSIVDLGSGAFDSGSPMMACGEQTLPSHGIHPSWHTLVGIGDLSVEEIAAIGVEAAGSEGLLVHFDAFARGVKVTGNSERCVDVFAPFGHDVTMAPNGVVGGGDGPCEPELEISKRAIPEEASPGDPVLFLIEVDNVGDCPVTTVVVRDEIPTFGEDDDPAFTADGSDPEAATSTDEAVTWTVDELEVGESVEIELDASLSMLLPDESEVVNRACINSAETAELCAESTVAIVTEIEDEACDEIGGPGFWCHQITSALNGRPMARFSISELEGWLEDVSDASEVFDELRDLGSIELAQALICDASDATEPRAKLMRHLVVLWFNLASGQVGADLVLGELEGEGALPEPATPQTTIGELIEAAESALVDEAEVQELLALKDVIDWVNDADTVDGGCDEPEAIEVPPGLEMLGVSTWSLP